MTNRIGHRHIFGVLIPDFNSVVEPELADLRVQGVSHQTARFPLDADVIEHVVGSAERLVPSGIGSWILALSTESFPGGSSLLDDGVERLRSRTGLRVHTATYASLAALQFMGARRLAIVTPFDEATNENVRAFYETRGFAVIAMAGLARDGFDQIANTSDRETADAFASVAKFGADTMLQVGTGLPMLHHIDILERRFRCPIVASNLAVYWQALRAAGIRDEISGFGQLLERSPDP